MAQATAPVLDSTGPLHRRSFLFALGSSAAAWPLAAWAQQPGMPVVAFFNSVSAKGYAHFVRAFHEGLGESGYVDGRNVAVEFHWAEGQNDRIPALAAALAARPVSVIAANTLAAQALKATATATPVVFITAGDPIALGLVASLPRPGANVTGVTTLNLESGQSGWNLCVN